MGGGTPQAPPSPPPPEQTTQSALQAELEFRPAFREEDVQDILRFAEASAEALREFGFPIAREQQALFRELEPETFAAREATAQSIIERLGSPITPETEAAFTERFRAQEAGAGRLGSPVGSLNVARNLTELEASERQFATSAGLSFLGRIPLGAASIPSGGERGVEFGRFVSPFLNQQASIFNTQGGIFGSQSQAATARRGQNFSLFPRVNLGFS